MKIKKYQVDAFADRLFEGNPAVVCTVESFPERDLMQKIAMEHNLSETAFVVPEQDHYLIRWFTPLTEVDLCGHATLASAYVLMEELKEVEDKVVFQTLKRGVLTVERKNERYELNFPSTTFRTSDLDQKWIEKCLDTEVLECMDGLTDCLILVENEQKLKNLKPDFTKLSDIDRRGFIVTAPSDNYDFVSRFFAPGVGVDEDPVTGSAHTILIPYWHEKLGKINMIARQISKRGGTLYCTYMNERVGIAGSAKLYSRGEILL
ncbi:PhzF family phenazine biosynthesis protein [Portibacter marinus]|uniref:PhzF family phenazine biosynthesis protein n=1 Tax=Portibacter marinus TaxID=2898660 RepID=UPI001F4882BC|nr:PhzF family phenazine biosynthesis protein [Portibacter marinus]